MAMPPVRLPSGGATVGVRVPEPAVDLAALVGHLAASVPLLSAAIPKFPRTAERFISWDASEKALSLNTDAVLTRLRLNEAARRDLRSFLIDAPVPRTVGRAHLGGVIKPHTDVALRDATKRLVAAIDAEIDLAVQAGFDPAVLSTTPSAAVLKGIGDRLGLAPGRMLQGPTRISRTRIEAASRSQSERRDEVARIVDAIEDVDGTRATHSANFFASVEERLNAERYSQRQIGAALQYHRRSAEKSGTQLSRFFDFLEDEALSRVRAQVGSHIMEALGAEAEERDRAGTRGDWALLAAYARRATALLAHLGSPEGPGLRINLSAEYGQNASFNLRDQVVNAGFAACLPVWPEWNTQMFEEQLPSSTPSGGPTTTRELTYHFRVNGIVPETGETSYVTRLNRIRKGWLRLGADGSEPAGREQRVNRSIAEVVFLWAAIPESETAQAETSEAIEAARLLAERLEEGGRPAIAKAVDELAARSAIVEQITRALIELLRDRGTAITRSATGRRWNYYVNVLPAIVDMRRISGELDEPLTSSAQPSQELIDFLRSICITRDKSLPGAVLSLRVQVRLMERGLSTVGEPELLNTRRSIPETLMQVVWRAFASDQRADERERAWLASPRVEVLYDTRTVHWPEGRATDPQELHVLAATRGALAVLAHTTLLRLVQRAEAATGKQATLSVLRLQQQGRNVEDLSGDEGVYAAAQAVEIVLARDAEVRMQGLSRGTESPYDRYKQRGAYAAMFAGFPLRISQAQGERPKIGVISYATRPCNEHPDLPNAQGCSLVLARIYLASPTETPEAGYEVRSAGGRTELCDPTPALPEVVSAEVERLYGQGCRHVILISHRFGQRRIGSGAAHPRLRDQSETLFQLSQSYPDLCIYPLVRDIFYATRLRQRQQEDAFEIVRPSDHLAGPGVQLTEEQARLYRRYEPVYSLATLHVVGGPAAVEAKPQSGFATYFLLRDSGMAPVEMRVQLEANLLGDASPVRSSLLGVLRGLHYLEAERYSSGKVRVKDGKIVEESYVQPVLDPYDWMTPAALGKVGEVLALPPSRRYGGSVGLSLVALLDRTSRIVHALPVQACVRDQVRHDKTEAGR